MSENIWKGKSNAVMKTLSFCPVLWHLLNWSRILFFIHPPCQHFQAAFKSFFHPRGCWRLPSRLPVFSNLSQLQAVSEQWRRNIWMMLKGCSWRALKHERYALSLHFTAGVSLTSPRLFSRFGALLTFWLRLLGVFKAHTGGFDHWGGCFGFYWIWLISEWALTEWSLFNLLYRLKHREAPPAFKLSLSRNISLSSHCAGLIDNRVESLFA